MVCSLDCIALLVLCYSIRFSRTLRDIFAVKTCEVFLCFLSIIFLGSIVLTFHRLLCMNCFTSLVRFTGFCTEYIWAHLDQCTAFQRGCLERRRITLRKMTVMRWEQEEKSFVSYFSVIVGSLCSQPGLFPV